MGPNEIAQEIDKLSLAEKLILVVDIWDGIARNNAKLKMLEWQKTELDRLYSEYKNGKSKFHDWEDVHPSLRKRS